MNEININIKQIIYSVLRNQKTQMAANQANIDKFVTLLEGRKIKELKTYLDRIADFDAAAQIIVSKAMERCLVNKKTTPLGIATALFIYKQMLIRSQFDFLESQSFNQKIHQFVYDACLHKCNAPIEERGRTYFGDTMKLPASKQTQQLGNTVIQLALEIVQQMAQWYPNDYFTDSPSRYAIYYKKLKQKKVEFPTKDGYYFMKPDDGKKFAQNHKKWILKMDELYNEDEDQTPQGNTNTTTNNMTKQNKQVAQSQPAKTQAQPPKPTITDANKPTTTNNTNNTNSNKQPIAVKPNGNAAKSSVQTNKTNVQALNKVDKKQIQSQIKQVKKIVTIKQDKPIAILNNQVKNKQIAPTFILQTNNNNNNNIINVKNVTNNQPQAKKVIQQTVTYNNNNNKSNNNNSNSNINNDNYLKPPNSSRSNASNVNVQQGETVQYRSGQNSLSGSRIQKKIQVPQKPPTHSQSPHMIQVPQQIKKQHIRQQARLQQRANQLIKKAQQLSQASSRINSVIKTNSNFNVTANPQSQINTNFNFNNNTQNRIQKPKQYMEQKSNTSPLKSNNVQRRTQSNFYAKNNQNQSPSKTAGEISRKIMKTEKNFWQPQQQQNNPAFRKSLPKTQNKNNFNNTQLLNTPFKLLNSQQKQNFIAGNTKQTLSDLRQAKYKIRSVNSTQISNKSLLQVIDRTKLGQVLIPFLPQYFQPVDLGMQALILQSLRVGSHPTLQPSKPFYKNEQLAVRLIKSQGSYILSIHNIGQNTFQIGYSQAIQAKFGNQFSSLIRVKSLGRRNLQEVRIWRADPNDFVDIPFSFQTKDPNFKFLQFVILFNNKNLPLNLPITLLDQGTIEKNIYLQDISSYINLYGRIFKSNPITLSLNDNHQHYEILPNFFQKSKLKDTQMLGHLTYTIQIDPSTIVRVTIFVKQISRNPSQYEIHALYDNRLPLNEDYAKVLIQVLCFLLSKHH